MMYCGNGAVEMLPAQHWMSVRQSQVDSRFHLRICFQRSLWLRTYPRWNGRRFDVANFLSHRSGLQENLEARTDKWVSALRQWSHFFCNRTVPECPHISLYTVQLGATNETMNTQSGELVREGLTFYGTKATKGTTFKRYREMLCLPTFCICVLYMIITANSYSFLEQR